MAPHALTALPTGTLKRSARTMNTDVCMLHLDQSSKQLRISLDGATSSKLGTLITDAGSASSCALLRRPRRSELSLVIRRFVSGRDACFVCGVLYSKMPLNSKLCYRHHRLTNSMVQRWETKKINSGNIVENKYLEEWAASEDVSTS